MESLQKVPKLKETLIKHIKINNFSLFIICFMCFGGCSSVKYISDPFTKNMDMVNFYKTVKIINMHESLNTSEFNVIYVGGDGSVKCHSIINGSLLPNKIDTLFNLDIEQQKTLNSFFNRIEKKKRIGADSIIISGSYFNFKVILGDQEYSGFEKGYYSLYENMVK